jgi:hypothetical protein
VSNVRAQTRRCDLYPDSARNLLVGVVLLEPRRLRMGKTHRERQDEKREARLAKMSEQIASGHLSVRQMTPEERSQWAERSAASANGLPAAELARRSAALKRRDRIQRMRTPPETPHQ